jgi:16S rRNA processing protein RimM
MIVLGRIVAPCGVRGWLKVRPFGDDPDGWRSMPQLWLGADVDGNDWQAFGLEELKPHGAGWIVKLAGVDDRSAAEALDGRFVGAARGELPRTQGNEFYWIDLIGLEVVNEQGESLGKVDSLLETGAHEVLVVMDGETKRLLPFVAQVVKDVDVSGGHVLVAWGRDW